jgi:hypothetical protein
MRGLRHWLSVQSGRREQRARVPYFLGDYQKRNGLKVDCWPTAAVLQQMDANKR